MHAVTALPEAHVLLNGRAEVHLVPVGRDNLVWLVVCTATREAAVVDGLPDATLVLEAVERVGAKLTTVWNTHTHWDHIGINQALEKLGLLESMAVYGCGERASEIPGLTHPVDEGDVVRVGQVEASVWRTDGHLNGHLTFVMEGAIFCGDTLFAGGCGYLFDGPPESMAASLWRLAGLPPDTLVFCAHEYTEDNLRFAAFIEPDNVELQARVVAVEALRARGECSVPSTIALEQATNPFLRPGSSSLLAKLQSLERPASSPFEAFRITRELKNEGVHKG